MKFLEYEMPEELHGNTVDPDVQRILGIYAEIDTTDEYKTLTHEKQAELLGEFAGRETFVGSDSDGEIQAVAVYTTDMSLDYAWIEGLAVHPDHRGQKKYIGSTMVRNLVSIARMDERDTIELSVIATAVPFWTKQGFQVTAVNPKNAHAMMRLEI